MIIDADAHVLENPRTWDFLDPARGRQTRLQPWGLRPVAVAGQGAASVVE